VDETAASLSASGASSTRISPAAPVAMLDK
jgi:hypothetical protein